MGYVHTPGRYIVTTVNTAHGRMPLRSRRYNIQRFSPGNNRPTASASFLRFSPRSREGASRHSVPYLVSFSSSACSFLGFTAGYDVWRIDATRYALTASDMTTDANWNGGGSGREREGSSAA